MEAYREKYIACLGPDPERIIPALKLMRVQNPDLGFLLIFQYFFCFVSLGWNNFQFGFTVH